MDYKTQVSTIIDTLNLSTETDKSILKSRFLGEVISYENRRDSVKKYYNAFRFTVTTGSILLPAILSIGQMDPAKLPRNFDTISYWASWTISLLVTTSNGFLQLFSLDKNYLEFAITTEQLKTEGWQYFQLSGKYEDCESHQEAYKSFNKSIENIKRKQVEKEFSGKGDVNKNKKDKKFDFQKELNKNLPDKYERDIEDGVNKVKNMSSLMDSRIMQLDTLMKNMENIKDNSVNNIKTITSDNGSNTITDTITETITDNIKKGISEKVEVVTKDDKKSSNK